MSSRFCSTLILIELTIGLFVFTTNANGQEQDVIDYSNSKWGFSFKYPSSWEAFSARSFTEQTNGLWNVPDAVVIVANTEDSEQNFFIKANPAPRGTIPKSMLEQMIHSLDQEYPQRYSGFKKLHARLVEMAGGTGVEYVMDNTRGSMKLRQKVIILIKNGKSFIWTFTAPRDKYDRVNKTYFEAILSSLRIE